VVRTAFAKINLGLHVLRRRQDGFHDLETVFLRIGWHDELSVSPAADLSMTCSDLMLPVDQSNLCIQAAQLVADSVAAGHVGSQADPGLTRPTHQITGAQIHLEKHLPYGAGLGGGSSDAAVTLMACNELWNANLDADELSRLASRLGSDVAFFLGGPVAFGSGKGEVLTAMEMPPALKDQWLSVIVPLVHVSTADAYAGIVPNERSRPDLMSLVAAGSLNDWRASLVNDFETTIFKRYPSIEAARDQLLSKGAGYAAMSGSGSSVFGVFTSEDLARNSVQELPKGSRSWVGRAEAAV